MWYRPRQKMPARNAGIFVRKKDRIPRRVACPKSESLGLGTLTSAQRIGYHCNPGRLFLARKIKRHTYVCRFASSPQYFMRYSRSPGVGACHLVRYWFSLSRYEMYHIPSARSPSKHASNHEPSLSVMVIGTPLFFLLRDQRVILRVRNLSH